MTHECIDRRWQSNSSEDFAGEWRCFDASKGPCFATIDKGRVVIEASNEDRAEVRFSDFDDDSVFAGNCKASFEADSTGGKLELSINGGKGTFHIEPFGERNGKRVIHCKGFPIGGLPGSWTAEEEDGSSKPPG
ncbi:MAG: hypothetical protein AAF560_27490 [Acidobacteriota bacterium]